MADVEGRVNSLEIRQAQTEAEIEDLRRQVGRLETDVVELRRELGEMRSEMTSGFKEVKDALHQVVLSALNSMPQWGATSMRTAWTLVGLLGGLLAAALGAWLTLR